MMKKIILTLAFLLIASTAFAASLAWDYDEYHDQTDGFIVHFTDGAEDYTYTFPATEAVVEGETVTWGPFEEPLNLHPGVEYTMNLARYNDAGSSGVEGQDPVMYTVEAYSPPPNRLPDGVISAPSGAGNLRIDN